LAISDCDRLTIELLALSPNQFLQSTPDISEACSPAKPRNIWFFVFDTKARYAALRAPYVS
jgi:hypothetical protein